MPEESEERGMGMPVIYTIMAVSVFILVILGIVLVSNQENSNSGKGRASYVVSPSPAPTMQTQSAEGKEDIETLYREHKLRAEDLDFWNMYDTQEPNLLTEPTSSPSPTPSQTPSPEELSTDGEHTLVVNREGEEEWMELSKKIPRHEYDFTDIKIVNGKMAYYQGKEKVSKLGVDLSKSSGTVDFQVLKEEGIDFVMLKLGGRGYDSGVITLDESFFTNLTGANEAGLDIGVSFYSQAITVEEAVEEAQFVIDSLKPYQTLITYPVVFDMEYAANDEARVELLDEEEKTEVAEAFLSTIEQEGYRPMLFGNKNWLLAEVLPEALLKEYEVWLNDQSPVPDYPYDFKMWRYAADETINGVEGKGSYTISFVDYTRK